MVKIEYNGLTAEVETADASKALAKLKREYRKAEQAKDALRQVAEAEALRNYARIVSSVCAVLDDGSSRYFRYYTAEDTGQYNPYARLNVETDLSVNRQTVKIHTENGVASLTLYGYRVSAVIESGNGYNMAVRLTDTATTPQPDYWCAVGVSGDQTQLQPLPARIGDLIEKAHTAYVDRKAESAVA